MESEVRKQQGGGDYRRLITSIDDNDYNKARRIVELVRYEDLIDGSREDPLIFALQNRKTLFVELLLSAGANKSATDADGMSVLSHAVLSQQTSAVEILLQKGACVNAADSDMKTPLMKAVTRSYVDSVKLLLDAGADTEVKGPGGKTALMFAVEKRNSIVVKMLIKGGACVNAVDDEGTTSLMNSVRYCNQEVAEMLLNFDADVNAINNRGQTALVEALYSCYISEVKSFLKFLIKHGAYINAVGTDNSVALTARAQNYDTMEQECSKHDKCSRSNAKVSSRAIPLMVAITQRDREVVELLLEHGACVNATDVDGQTPLMAAIDTHESGTENTHPGYPVDLSRYKRSMFLDSLAFQNKSSPTTSSSLEKVQLLIERGACVNAADTNGKTALMMALMANNSDVVRILLQENACVNVHDNNGTTPLMVCLQEFRQGPGRIEIEQLLELGACVNVEDKDGATPLTTVVSSECGSISDSFEVVKLLLEHGASVNSSDFSGRTPLMKASKTSAEVVKLLIDHDACVNTADRNGQTPLIFALKNNNSEVAVKLIDNGACVNVKDNEGASPLTLSVELRHDGCIVEKLLKKGACVSTAHMQGKCLVKRALEVRSSEVVELLVKHGACVDARYSDGTTPLLIALESRFRKETIKTLVEHGACINIADLKGQTPLMKAFKKKSRDLVQLLIERGACLDVRFEDGSTPLFFALKQDYDKKTIESLLEHGACVNDTANDGKTPLLVALENNRLCSRNAYNKMLQLLLEQGACTEVRDNKGNTPFSILLKHYNGIDAAKLLLDYGACIEAKDGNGNTPLMVAIKEYSRPFSGYRESNIEVIKLLLERGTSANVQNNEGDTPLLAVLHEGLELYPYGQEKVKETMLVRLLLDHGARVDVSNDKGIAPLMAAVYQRNIESVQLLLNCGACVNSADTRGRTSLMVTASAGPVDVMKLLIEYGADVDVKDNEGQTALMIAVCGRNSEIVQNLLDNNACVNSVDIKGQSALMVAVKEDDIDLCEKLIHHGARIDLADKEGNTLLMLAAGTGNLQMIQRLVQSGAESLNFTDSKGYTAIMKLVESRHRLGLSSALKFLVRSGGNVHAVANDGKNALLLAAKSGNVDCLEVLLECGVDKLDLRDSNGFTALMYLLLCRQRRDFVESVYKLIALGACVNSEANDGQTPLSLALSLWSRISSYESDTVIRDSEQIIINLLDHGADIATSKENQKYLNKMVLKRKNKILQKMILNGCPPLSFPCSILRDQPVEPRSPLQVALLSNNIDAFRYFISNGFLTAQDVTDLCSFFQDASNIKWGFSSQARKERHKTKVMERIESLLQLPLSLFKLSFVAVSSALQSENNFPQSNGDEESMRSTYLSHMQNYSALPPEVNPSRQGLSRTNINDNASETYKSGVSTQARNEEGSCRHPERNPSSHVDDKNAEKLTESCVPEGKKLCEALNSAKPLSRKEKVELLPLPNSLKQALLFQTPAASIDPKLWRNVGGSKDAYAKDDNSNDGATSDNGRNGSEDLNSNDGVDSDEDFFYCDKDVTPSMFDYYDYYDDPHGSRDYYNDSDFCYSSD